MPSYEFEGRRPQVDPAAYVHPEATLIGEVTIGPGCYVGPGARLRGDFGAIEVGPGSNVQDNCVIHSRPGAVTRLGAACHVGHGAVVHGANLGEHVTVGMGAVVQDGADVGADCLIAAGAVVLAGSVVPAGQLLAGVPARLVGDLTAEQLAQLRAGTALYQALPDRYRAACRRLPDPAGQKGADS